MRRMSSWNKNLSTNEGVAVERDWKGRQEREVIKEVEGAVRRRSKSRSEREGGSGDRTESKQKKCAGNEERERKNERELLAGWLVGSVVRRNIFILGKACCGQPHFHSDVPVHAGNSDTSLIFLYTTSRLYAHHIKKHITLWLGYTQILP